MRLEVALKDRKSKNRENILLGCAVLQAMAPGVPKSGRVIAAACGITSQGVYDIEARALRKLRKRVPGLLRDLQAELERQAGE